MSPLRGLVGPTALGGAALGAVLVAPLVAALVTTPVLGPQDLPLHALLATLAAAPDPLPPFAARQAVPWFAPYRILYDLLGAAGPGGVEALMRGLLVVLALATPAAAARAAAAVPRAEPRLAAAVAVVPLTSFLLWSGFLAFLLAAPLALVTLEAALTLARTPGRRAPALRGAAALVGAYLLHPLALAAALVPVSAAVAARRGRAGRPLLALAGLGLGLALLTGALTRPDARVPPGTDAAQLRAHLGAPDAVAGQAALLVRAPWVHLGPSRADVARLAALLVAAGALAATLVGPRGGPGLAPGARATLGATVAAPAALTALLPNWVFNVSVVGPRFAAPTLLGLAAAVGAAGGRGPRRAREGGLALATVGAAVLSLGAADALRAVGRELAPVRAIGAALRREPRPLRPLLLAFDPASAAVVRWFGPGLNAGQWALALAGAADAREMPHPFLPVRLGDGAPPAPNSLLPAAYDPDRHGPYSHIIVRRRGQDPAERAAVARVARDHDLVLAVADWALYRRRP